MTDKRVLSFQPDSEFYHKRADKYNEKGEYTAALKNLRKAAELEPDNLECRLDIANTYARMGLYERSNLEIQMIFHLPNLPQDALYGMASNYLVLGDYDQAESMFQAYLQFQPDGEYADQAADALGYIADCDYETELDRELDELSMDGKAALDAGDLDHAIDCLERALEKEPSMTYVRNNLAVAYYCVGNMEKAWEHIQRVLEEAPLDVHGRCNESMFYLVDGRKEEAIEAVRKLQLERIEEIDELFKYCLALADTGLDAELMQALKKIFLQCPYDVSMLYLYGVCLYNQGRYQESLLTFEKLTLTDPDSLLATWGMKLVSAAVREGTPPIERIPYTYDLPEELQRRITEELESMGGRKPDEIAQVLRNADERRLIRAAAMMGGEEQMTQAIMLMGYSRCPEGERLLREILLSPTHNSMFKQMVMEMLRSMQAPEPYYCLQDGKLVLVRRKKLDLGAELPKGYVNVMHGLIEHMMNHYSEKRAAEFAAGLWAAYLFSLNGNYPRLTKPEAWIYTLEGMYLESAGREADWAQLAQQAGVTERVLMNRKKKLEKAGEEMQMKGKDGQ